MVGGAPTDTLRRVLLRECGNENDSPCAQNIEREVNMLAFYYENVVTQEVNGLTDMMRTVGTLPGRKTVVLLSGGMPAADRPGARPNISDLARVLGEEAARANTTIYTLFLDQTIVSDLRGRDAQGRSASGIPGARKRGAEPLSRSVREHVRRHADARRRRGRRERPRADSARDIRLLLARSGAGRESIATVGRIGSASA